MADITMCTNTTCPLWFECYRAQAVPDKYAQAYARFDFSGSQYHASCEHFLKIEPAEKKPRKPFAF